MTAPLLPGLPGYDDPQLIAHGTTALVFRATQTRLNRPVAIKVITTDSDNGSVPVNVERELATTVALSSQPHIVSIIDTGVTDDGRRYIVMEYCEDGSYAQILRQHGPLPVDDVVEVGIKIGLALHAAHEAGIVHRDVKPSNILRSRFGPALTDFGIARAPDELSSTLTREMMTPHHASPEALLHQAQSGLSDVYSLASTLWTLLVGHPPFVDPQRPDVDMYQFRDRVLHEPLPAMPREDVPAWLVTELRRAMAKLPAQRHGSAREFSEALQRGALGVGPVPGESGPRDDRPDPAANPASPAGLLNPTAGPLAPTGDPLGPAGGLSGAAAGPPGPAAGLPGPAAGPLGPAGGPTRHTAGLPAQAWPVPDMPAPAPLSATPEPAPISGVIPTPPPPAPISGVAPVPPPPVSIPPAPASPPSTPAERWPETPPASARAATPPPGAPLAPAPSVPAPPAPSAPAPSAPAPSAPASPGQPWVPPPVLPAPPPSRAPTPPAHPLALPDPAEAAEPRPTSQSAGSPGTSPAPEGGWLPPTDQPGAGDWPEVSVDRLRPRPHRDHDVTAPSGGRRGGLLAVLVGVTVIAVVSIALLFLRLDRGAPVSAPSEPVTEPGSSQDVTPTTITPLPDGAPTDVRIEEDNGTSATLAWTDPAGGTRSYIAVAYLSGSEVAEQYKSVPSGSAQMSVTFTGLDANEDYCFTVGVIYSVTEVARAPAVCTHR